MNHTSYVNNIILFIYMYISMYVFLMFMYEGPTADELCSVGWYLHVCMFLFFIDFLRCCIYLYPQ